MMPAMSWGAVFAFLAWVWGVAAVALLGGVELAEGARGAVEAVRLAASEWRPVGPWLVPNALRSAGSVGVALFLLALSHALGGCLLLFCVNRPPSRALSMTAAFGGYAALSLAVLGCAATGLCTGPVLAGLAVAAVAVAWQRLALLPGRAWDAARRAARGSPVLVAGVACLVIANLPRLVVPEHNEDCLMYHLALPQQLLLRHHLPERGGYWAWGFPLLADFPNVFAVACGTDAAVRLAGLGFAWLGACACVRSVAPALGGAWTLLLGLVPLLVPSENWVLLTAKDDLVVCGLWLAAAAASMEAGVWRRGGWRRGPGAWAAWLGGSIVASKLALAPAVAAAGALALIGCPVRPRIWGMWGLAAFLPLAPWLLRAWIQYGDPVHPFGAAVLPSFFGVGGNGGAIRIELDGLMHEGLNWLAAVREAGGMLLRDGYPVIAALPVLVARAGPAGAWALAAAVAGVMALTLATPGSQAQLPRFMLPASALLNAVSVAALARAILDRRAAVAAPRPEVRQKQKHRAPVPPPVPPALWPGHAAAAVVCLLIGVLACRLQPIVTWVEDAPGLRGRAWLAGRMDTETYRRSLMGSWGLVQPVVAARSTRGRSGAVLVLGGKYMWGIPARVVTNEMGMRPAWEAVASSPTPDRVAVRFRQMGVGLIVFDADYASWDRTVPASYPWDDRQLRLYTEYAKRWFRVVTSTACRTPGFGMHWILEVPARPHPPARRVSVLPGADPAWAPAMLKGAHGDTMGALSELTRLALLLPEVTEAQAALGQAYVDLKRFREAYPIVRAAAEEGFLNCANPMLLDWATSALMTGRTAEADRLYLRAMEVYDRWDSVMRPKMPPAR